VIALADALARWDGTPGARCGAAIAARRRQMRTTPVEWRGRPTSAASRSPRPWSWERETAAPVSLQAFDDAAEDAALAGG
jgi:hypothetical protein